jgi:ParB-like chromosome segregation protein Spo0J
MAMKLNVSEDFSRKDYFFVSPYDIKVVEELRGRHTPPSEEKIIEMAESLLDHGQQQPVQCRKIEGNRLQLNMGFTRTAAARLIREGFTDNEGVKRGDPEFKLKVIIVESNDETAFINNIVENQHRNETNPIDDAHNQYKLSDRYGKSDAEIAKIYKYKNTTKVAKLRRLLSLSKEHQDMVAKGTLSVETAMDVLELPAEKRDEAIATAIGGTGRVKASVIREEVRDHVEAAQTDQQVSSRVLADPDEHKPGVEGSSGVTSTREQPRHKPRTLSDERKLLEYLQESAETDAGKALAKAILAHIKGSKTDQYLVNEFNKATGGQGNISLPKKKGGGNTVPSGVTKKTA